MKLMSKKERDLERKVANLQRDKKRLQSKLNRIKRLLRGVWNMKCRKPLLHKPEFEGKVTCKQCEREVTEDAYDYLVWWSALKWVIGSGGEMK